MPQILFVNVQDRSGLNQSLIRRHAAEDAHRKKRLTEIFRHQNHIVARRKPLASRPAQEPPRTNRGDDAMVEDENAKERLRTLDKVPAAHRSTSITRQRKQARDPKIALTLRWRVGNPTSIEPPTDDLKIEYVLSESFNWMMGQYTSSWSSLVRRDPKVFDLNGEVEILREAFYIVTDLLGMKKTSAAFAVLRHTLDAIPATFRDPHPELLFTLVELAYGINMTGPTDLQAKVVRPHVAELASTIMGNKHPLTILLKSEFDAALQSHVTELVFRCIIDAMSKTFGKAAYQTLVQQMGRSQFYARTGRGDEAQRLIAEIQQHWKHQYGPDSALARLAELELCLMRLQGSKITEPSLEAQANNAILRIQVMAGVYSNKFTDRPSYHPRTGDKSPSTMALAHWFLQKKRYTFALHCYERSKRDTMTGGSLTTPDRPLADLIANTVMDAMSDMLLRPGNLLTLPSQAQMRDSMVAASWPMQIQQDVYR
ncbi:hypothetical protein H2200_001310 [Cladophialophora chaetospira]|uniref:Clr5 domain-containing protein n=1 Tax=Cladophialophora chaetospira TaxID=386627 RepID=A0AA39CNY3_9EURO|nr:hypothetical protein H2200_001310 [Cladophialophora chaetospira]